MFQHASRAMIAVMAALLAAALLGLGGCNLGNRYPQGIIQLPRTGQTTSYAPGDDGALISGVEWPSPRFTDNGDTITDNLTGLMWYANGTYFDDYWVDAIADIDGATLGTHDDWRMPDALELFSLLSDGAADPAVWLNGLGFSNIQDSYYYTSTTCASDTARVHGARMGTANGNAVSKTSSMRYVLAVRGQAVGAAVELPRTGQTTEYTTGDDGDLQHGIVWPNPRFYVNAEGTIVDALTGLVWDAKANRIGGTWDQVLDDVAGLELYGWSDWRVPNRVEMMSLLNLGQADTTAWLTSTGFTDVQAGLYWTSTTWAGNTGSAWCVDTSSNGWPSNEDKMDTYYVLVVRGPGAD
jgi:hypothetical protein